ncbi:MAG: aminotransferase class I/II-fold pyridoxal phosphate-dependent enzyme [Thermodesulfobacteriota bacterium]|nr:aminotransferase class I/II-fold pyridoxal phosphate-dependent enzyme [Thermodesulfobacteriota bacterium]
MSGQACRLEPGPSLVMSTPAKQTGWMCDCGKKLTRVFTCPVCGRAIDPPLVISESDRSEADNGESNAPRAFVDPAAQQKIIQPAIENNIKTVLKHGRYIMVPEVAEFETKLAEFAQIRHVIACASGADALLMSLMASGIGPGDAVFTSPFTFISTAEVITLLGADPVFVDIDPATLRKEVRQPDTDRIQL